MPNVESENKNNATSSRKKDKRKSLAVTTEKDVSTLPQETLSPITPALESGESENVNKNPYIDVINKRVKKLKKMMIKIDKYEAIQNSSSSGEVPLNDDQIKVLERKGEVSGAIKEFDETLKQIEVVEKEELKKQAELKKVQQAERDKAIVDAVEEVKAAHCKSLLQLILFFRLVHFQQRNIIQLSDNEFEAVETLRAKLTTLAENDELYEEKSRQVLDLVNKLHSDDESLIPKSLSNGVNETDQIASSDEPSYGISYSHLRSLIQSPPILESSGDQEELIETFEIINSAEHIDVTNEYNNISELQFMRPEDQSQAFDTTINNTTYSYQSIDAEQTTAVVTDETIVDHNVQEQYNQQQQGYDTYAVEQQHFTVEQQPYIGGEQQQQQQQQHHHFTEQEDQQHVPTEQDELSQQQDEQLLVQESQITSEDQADLKQPQETQQNSNQPPPLSQGSGGYRSGRYRNSRGNRGQGSRRDSSGYNNYGGGYHRDGGSYGSYRGRGGPGGPRGGRGGGGFQGGNRGTPYRQRSQ